MTIVLATIGGLALLLGGIALLAVIGGGIAARRMGGAPIRGGAASEATGVVTHPTPAVTPTEDA